MRAMNHVIPRGEWMATTTNVSHPASDTIDPPSSHRHAAKIPAIQIANDKNPVCTSNGCVNGLGMPSPMAMDTMAMTKNAPERRAIHRQRTAPIFNRLKFIATVRAIELYQPSHHPSLPEIVSPSVAKEFRNLWLSEIQLVKKPVCPNS